MKRGLIGLIGAFAALLILFWLVSTAAGQPQAAAPPVIDFAEVAGGFSGPLAAVSTGIPGDTRLFIVEKRGVIKIIDRDGTAYPTPFLDISTLVSTDSERGLLGLAFDPDFAQNGRFYIDYTRSGDGATEIVRYTVSANPDAADPASATLLLRVPQDAANHNGGDLHFGPDGYLYISLGDGGGGNDPNNRGQDTTTLLGSLLRIDVDPTAGLPADCGEVGNYSIPADNPFVGNPDGCNEIWAYGLRNPWRISFDRLTGDLYIGDVGQNAREEIDFQPAASTGGADYGWRCFEGTIDTPGAPDCDPGADYVPPIYDYPRTDGQSVTGGFVYRGNAFPRMRGYYFFGDFVSGRLWRAIDDGGWVFTDLGQTDYNISSFGEDNQGELYLVHYNGTVYRLVDQVGFELGLSGPHVAGPGEPISYTLAARNVGFETAQNVVISNTLPGGATYLSGGSLNGDVVTWSVGPLTAGAEVTVTFAVTATQTITNTTYGVSADTIEPVSGLTSLKTQVFNPLFRLYVPFLFR